MKLEGNDEQENDTNMPTIRQLSPALTPFRRRNVLGLKNTTIGTKKPVRKPGRLKVGRIGVFRPKVQQTNSVTMETDSSSDATTGEQPHTVSVVSIEGGVIITTVEVPDSDYLQPIVCATQAVGMNIDYDDDADDSPIHDKATNATPKPSQMDTASENHPAAEHEVPNEDSNVKTEYCEVCKKRYMNRKSLRRHEKTKKHIEAAAKLATPQSQQSSEEVPATNANNKSEYCEVCNEAYASRKSIQSHRRTKKHKDAERLAQALIQLQANAHA